MPFTKRSFRKFGPRRRQDIKRATALRRKIRRASHARKLAIRRPIALQTHSFVRRWKSHTITALAAGANVGNLTALLSNVPNLTEYTVLFDSYMVTYVKFEFVPVANTATFGGAALGHTIPQLMWVVDRDDTSTPATDPNIFLENVRSKKRWLRRPVTIKLKPNMLQNIYRGAANPDGHVHSYNKWCDMAQTDVIHYGIKWLCTYSGYATGDNLFDIYTTLYFKCKSGK